MQGAFYPDSKEEYINTCSNNANFYRYSSALIIIAGILLRIIAVGRNLEYDEFYTYLSFIKYDPHYIFTHIYHSNNHVLNSLITHFFITVLGKSDLILRLSALILGCLTLPSVYFFGKDLFDRRIALIATFLMAIAPYHIRYSSECRGYSGFVLFSIIAVWMLYKGLDRRKLVYWFIFTISSIVAAGFNLFGSTLLLPYSIFVFLWLILQLFGKKDSTRNGLISFLQGVLFIILASAGIFIFYSFSMPLFDYAAYFMKNCTLPENSFLAFSTYIHSFDHSFLGNLFGLLGWGTGWNLLVFVALSLLGLIYLLCKEFRQGVLLLLIIALPLAAAYVIGMNVIFRLFIFILPFYCLLVSAGFIALFLNKYVLRYSRETLLILFALLVIAALNLNTVAFYYATQVCGGGYHSWRKAMNYISRRSGSKDFVLGTPYGSTSSFENLALAYYLDKAEFGHSSDLLGEDIILFTLSDKSDHHDIKGVEFKKIAFKGADISVSTYKNGFNTEDINLDGVSITSYSSKDKYRISKNNLKISGKTLILDLYPVSMKTELNLPINEVDPLSLIAYSLTVKAPSVNMSFKIEFSNDKHSMTTFNEKKAYLDRDSDAITILIKDIVPDKAKYSRLVILFDPPEEEKKIYIRNIKVLKEVQPR